ncbi:M56 family metallopeptidase [Aneurinibacillus aneurinilyticus]|jgi:Zn-dependent protease with chaperone function|uniref:M56 family metallopeptidase n=3 Tax=Aneurinibacillus aneurinilyticus TaxID=1391 RepID=A0A848CWT1_ANEAE|nr:M56 family metallopeptidase [Aneurinibacillus aneurinilyticus]ERI07869.1 peptidase, M48 family [Aneurinibacillus aneurinilyticus ATCC 12856]MCI1695072.1 M56 family metallopeptidase [Aneurinibacillus aneurinilyticus]MED0670089.1 M56 family metallopeptidase [Aneurinibacillus aneurinilyticus]MED0706314.1 M56 family metallopeptidase [Aneurinibacillus aneurinilyticus]MED0725274.1 M56 family metallopeptidase [Aneurinibacillus aneurinilyticus]
MRWKQKSFLVIGLSLLIAILVWSQIGMYLVHILFGVSIQVNFFKFCISLFREGSFYYFLIIILLNTLIIYTVLITLIRIGQQYFLYSRFRKKIFALRNIEITGSLIRAFQRQNQDIIVINHEQLLAFTMGFRRPCIVLSTGLIEILEDHELEAVVEHETFHQQNYDSLKIFTLQLISQSLWFIPLTKWSYRNYKIISELLADEYAIQKMGSELGLGSALLKLIKNCFHANATPVLAHFSDESVNYRLQQLVDPKRTIPVRMDAMSILISIHVILIFMSMIMLAAT